MAYHFDETKPVTTRRCNRKVRVICNDRKHECPIVALVQNGVDEEDMIIQYLADGRCLINPGLDLVNIVEDDRG